MADRPAEAEVLRRRADDAKDTAAVSTMTPTAASTGVLPRWQAWSLILLAIVGAAAGPLLYKVYAPDVPGLVDIELAKVTPADPSVLRDSLWPGDAVLIVCYGLTLLAGGFLARRMAWTRTSHTLASFGVLCSAVAILSDVVEDVFLALGDRYDWCYSAAGAAATVKWSVLVPAALVAAIGVLLAIARLLGNSAGRLGRLRERLTEADFLPAPPLDPPPPPVPAGLVPGPAAHDRWRNAYRVPGVDPTQWTDESFSRTAVCLSGGGVRSASLALGAIQTLRTTVKRADYVISVSGGGYTAGALLQALTSAGAKPGDGVDRDPDEALSPGSVSEDHLRRHSSYIASSAGQIGLALLLLARGLLASLFVLFSGAIVIGVLIGSFYAYVPITELKQVVVPEPGSGVAFPRPSGPALVALLFFGGVTVVSWMVGVVLASWRDWYSRACRVLVWTAKAFAGVTAVIGLFVVGIPALTWLCAWTYAKIGDGPTVAIGGSVLTVVLSYFAALASMLWKRQEKKTTAATSSTGKAKAVVAAVPRSLLQLLYVVVVLGLLSALWLLIFGLAASTQASYTARVTATCVAAGWLFVGGLVDETALSLHPFYRRRLASAFAVRTQHKVAVAYPPTERTTLSEYGRVHPTDSDQHFPEFVFAAAANLTDDDRTAPGLRAVSYVLTADHLGGPDVGWVRTRAAIDACPPVLKNDLTVQAAVAISGAAFAAAMGRASAWYQTLLGVSGARLGTWLPHPDYMMLRRAGAAKGDWTLPGLPHVRRFPYLLREVFGIHPYFQRLLHVTDGGHYENLGLVEALRRRCTEIYVIDASGDSPPSASTFAEAIRLARAELGVEISPDKAWDIEPGSATSLQPSDPLAALNKRLSSTAVLTAKISYPKESGLPEGRREGRLILAKALLWPELPYDVLSYAAKHDVFPHDSTADQWFDEGQFAQYTELGRRVAEAAEEAAQEDASGSAAAPPVPPVSRPAPASPADLGRTRTDPA